MALIPQNMLLILVWILEEIFIQIVSGQGCRDRDRECTMFAAWGECQVNPRYMRTNCAYSCGLCQGSRNCAQGEIFNSQHVCDFMCPGVQDRCPRVLARNVQGLPKCGCQQGLVRNRNQNRCIQRSQCPRRGGNQVTQRPNTGTTGGSWYCDALACINVGNNPPIPRELLFRDRATCDRQCNLRQPEYFACSNVGCQSIGTDPAAASNTESVFTTVSVCNGNCDPNSAGPIEPVVPVNPNPNPQPVESTQVATRELWMCAGSTPCRAVNLGDNPTGALFLNEGVCNSNCQSTGGIETGVTAARECSNNHARCAEWAGRGECRVNRIWMSDNCRQSCGTC